MEFLTQQRIIETTRYLKMRVHALGLPCIDSMMFLRILFAFLSENFSRGFLQAA